jgi:DNA-binding NarL/FixJ family response regulator
MRVVAQASSGHEAVQFFAEFQPDITLMELWLPDMNGIDALMAIRSQSPDARIVILTILDRDMQIHRALAAGAKSYMFKSVPPVVLVDTLRQVHAGKKWIPPEVASILADYISQDRLTNREVEVLKLAKSGNRNHEIAGRLLISQETVKAHIKHAMQKLGARGRTEAVAIALRRGLIQA